MKCPVCRAEYAKNWINRHLIKVHGWRYEDGLPPAKPPELPQGLGEK